MTLRNKAVSGVKWTTGSTLVSSTLQLAQLAVLARLLTPRDFGLMAMIMVVLGFAQKYVDMGVGNAIIHKQDTTRDQLSSLYWLNLLSGAVVFLLVLASSPLIVGLFREPKLSGLLPWAACVFLLTAPGHQFQILLQKHLRFNVLAAADIAAVTAGFIAAVVFALRGWGVFSLVFGQLTQAAARTTVLVFIGMRIWRPRRHFSRRDLRGYLSFGLFQMGEKTVTYFSANLDKLLIGTLLGSQALGFYSLAWNLVIQPVVRINPIVTRVAFPVFSLLQHDAVKLRKGYLDVLRVLTALTFPILVGLAATASVLVPVVFGREWLAAVPIVQLLAGVAMFRAQGNPVGSLLLAKGRADLGFAWNSIKVIAQIPAVYVGAKVLGATGVAAALFLLQILVFVPSFSFLIRRLIPCDWPSYLGAMSRNFGLSLIMGAAVFFVTRILSIQTGLGAAILIAAGAGIYALLSAAFNRALIRDIAAMAAEAW